MSANREGFKARYAECEIIGPPEVREVSSEDRHYTPHPRAIPSSANNLGAVLAIARSARPVAWLDSACVWQLQRRGGYHYELQPPEAAIPPEEDAVSIAAATCSFLQVSTPSNQG